MINSVFSYGRYRVVFSGLLLLLSACSSSDVKHGKQLTVCPAERIQVCTREYRPVCGAHVQGRDRTYSTGCVACSNPEVTSYREGICKK